MGYFSCNGAARRHIIIHLLIQQKFEELLWARHSCSTHARVWGSVWGIDQLSQADLNQSWQANIFCSVHNVDPYNIFSSTLRYNLLTIKCMYFKCTLSISSDKCHSYVVTLPRKNTFPSPLKSSYSRSPLPTPAPLTDLISIFFPQNSKSMFIRRI